MRRWGGLVTGAAALWASAAVGQGVTVPMHGKLTSIDLKTCTRLTAHRDGGSWRCRGLRGYPVRVAEGDLRHFVSFGPSPEKRRAASQTLAPFNSIFKAGQDRATIEWRTDRRGGRDVPYAAIMRWYTARDGSKGEVIVVTRITDREACQAAVIDALANTDALALARSFADLEAKTTPCAPEPRRLGAAGKSPM